MLALITNYYTYLRKSNNVVKKFSIKPPKVEDYLVLYAEALSTRFNVLIEL